MKLNKLLITAALFFALSSALAQITITKADMPNVGDNIFISVKTSLTGFDPTLTGPNYTWDYSTLIPDSQRFVKFESPASTPYALPFAFLSTYGVRNYTPDQLPWSLLGSPPTNVYDFYKNSTADYKCVGEPLTEGTMAIPLPYSVADRVYKFPLNYLQKDSSTMVMSLPNIPGLGSYVKKQKRVNEVDGWGTLTTAFGTFNTLRVKSTLTITDSIYIDTIGLGFTIPRPLQYEFKWLAKGMKIPVLEIDGTGGVGNIIAVSRVNWEDSAMVVSFTEQSSCPIVNEGSLTANVTGGKQPLSFLWSTGETTQSINNVGPGLYTVTVTNAYGTAVHVSDSVNTVTDSSCMILVYFDATKSCPGAKEGALTATVVGARNPSKYLWSTGDTTTAISGLAPGNYDFTVTDKYGRQVTSTGTVDGKSQDLTCLNIPSAFTPDNDGVNDVWKIRNLSDYTDCKVEVFNQWGSLIFKSTGYTTPWDGKYNGEAVAAGAYYYVIDLNNNTKKFTGTVTIVK